jgi:DNA-binding NarL/FixJ family response regulator
MPRQPQTPATRARVLLVEDHHLMSQGLKSMLEPEYEVVGIAADGEAALEAATTLRPDVVLLDLSLPRRPGSEVLQELAARPGGPAVIIVTMHTDRALATRALQLGARGFVPKNAKVGELKDAIRAALAGRRYLSPLLTDASPASRSFPDGYLRLTSRQLEIIRHIAHGRTSEEIAETLHLSYHTVHFHRRNIRRLLDLHTERDLIEFSIRVREIEEPKP